VESKAATLLCQYEVWSNDGNLSKSGLKLWRESCAEVLKGKKAKELDENEGPFFPAFQHVFRKLELILFRYLLFSFRTIMMRIILLFFTNQYLEFVVILPAVELIFLPVILNRH
jgi:hypothetical protein